MKGFGIHVKNDLLDPKHVENMGASVWLYMWFLDKMTSINENGVGKVLGGKPVIYEEVIVEIPLSVANYRRYIKRLKEHGYINTIRTPYGLSVTVNKAFKPQLQKRSIKNDTSGGREMYQNRTRDVSKPIPRYIKSDTSNIRHNKDITKTKGNSYKKERQKAAEVREILAARGIVKPGSLAAHKPSPRTSY